VFWSKKLKLGFAPFEIYHSRPGYAVLLFFLNMKWAQHLAVRQSIAAPEFIRHDIKHTKIILKLVKFHAYVD